MAQLEDSASPAKADQPVLWVLHCDADGRPGICDWARTAADAEAKLTSLRDEQKQFKFWSTTLTAEEAVYYKQNGLIPDDA